MSLKLSNLPSSCELKLTLFTDTRAHYHYECFVDQFSYNINITEDSGESLKEEVKRETESEVQDLRVVKDFTFKNSEGVIVATFPSSSYLPKDTPLEYRLHWMHNENLLTIHTNNTRVITQDKLIELLGLMK